MNRSGGGRLPRRVDADRLRRVTGWTPAGDRTFVGIALASGAIGGAIGLAWAGADGDLHGLVLGLALGTVPAGRAAAAVDRRRATP